jgi:hypothetical protein
MTSFPGDYGLPSFCSASDAASARSNAVVTRAMGKVALTAGVLEQHQVYARS